MKKILGITLSLFCIVALLFSFVLTTGYAEMNYTAVLDIDGEVIVESVSIDENKKLRIGDSFCSFVESRLDKGNKPEDILNYISPNLGTAFYEILKNKEIQPINAEMNVDLRNSKFEYVYGKYGKLFDQNEACIALAKALDGEKQSIKLKDTPPEITVKDLKERTVLIGRFTTSIATSKADRKHNVKLASSYIHGTVLKSGEEFSFNKIVGERSKERGFKNAKIISDGKYVEGIGGGVCQLATTLYNAALLSGLKITAVARHTFAPSYVAPSRDAMVSSSTDFRFVNDTNYDIYLFSRADEDSVTVSIYGLKSHTVYLESVTKEIISFLNEDKEGNILDDITDKTLIFSGIDGVKSELFVIKDGKRKKVRSDFYKSKNAVYE